MVRRNTHLFKNEHRVVKELLKFLIRVVDTQLFEIIHLKGLRTKSKS